MCRFLCFYRADAAAMKRAPVQWQRSVAALLLRLPLAGSVAARKPFGQNSLQGCMNPDTHTAGEGR